MDNCGTCGLVNLDQSTCNFCQTVHCTAHIPRHFNEAHQRQVDHFKMTVASIKSKQQSILYE